MKKEKEKKKSSIKRVGNNHCEEGEVITNYHYNIFFFKKKKKIFLKLQRMSHGLPIDKACSCSSTILLQRDTFVTRTHNPRSDTIYWMK
jgi:hypothetical protein